MSYYDHLMQSWLARLEVATWRSMYEEAGVYLEWIRLTTDIGGEG